MVTVSAGATMNVSGMAEANPLHTLAAVGGAPTKTDPNKRHFFVGAGSTLHLAHVKLVGGRVVNVPTSGYADEGGSILVSGAFSSLIAIDVDFIGCKRTEPCAYEGGILIATAGATVSIVDSTFRSSNTQGRGGAIYVAGEATHCSFRRTMFDNNTGTYGGAIFTRKLGSLLVALSTIETVCSILDGLNG